MELGKMIQKCIFRLPKVYPGYTPRLSLSKLLIVIKKLPKFWTKVTRVTHNFFQLRAWGNITNLYDRYTVSVCTIMVHKVNTVLTNLQIFYRIGVTFNKYLENQALTQNLRVNL